MQTIRAKFKCTQVTSHESFDKTKGPIVHSAELHPVVSGSAENDAFYAATPGGQITLASYVSNEFVPGQEYFVDFTLVK